MIRLKNLSKSYGDTQAVKDISFTVEKGEIVGILGPNGAGKSSTIRILCGYFSATSGHVEVDENVIECGDINIATKEMIGYLPESAPLYREMIVYDYLSFIWMLREGSKIKNAKERTQKAKQRVLEVCTICKLDEVKHKNIEELSKGYRQRVGLASALIGDPEILVLDEPTSGLDPNQIIEMRNLIKEIGKTKTVLLCSHILHEVEATCDRVVIMKEGKIVADDTTANLKKRFGFKTRITLGFRNVDAADVERELQKLPDVDVQKTDLEGEKDAVGFILYSAQAGDCRDAIYDCIKKNNWSLIAFYKSVETLEDVFRELTLPEHSAEVLEDGGKLQEEAEKLDAEHSQKVD